MGQYIFEIPEVRGASLRVLASDHYKSINLMDLKSIRLNRARSTATDNPDAN